MTASAQPTTRKTPVDFPPGLTRQLAAFVAGLQWADLPAHVRTAAPYYLTDYLANAFGGGGAPSSAAMERFVAGLGLTGESTVIGRAYTLPPHYAALVNGQAAHCLESDDTHQASSSHPGASVWSAALALGEACNATLAEVFTAAVAGYELIGRLGAALGPAEHYDHSFHPTGTCGVFGCAAVASRLLGLDAERTNHAFGIAGSMAAGSMEFLVDGAWTKRLHPGWAAHSGILAAQLAASGFTGPQTIIEGRTGFLNGYSDGARAEPLLAGLGSDYQLVRTSIKAHACCRYKQAPIDGLLAILRKHQLTNADVRRVRTGILAAGWNIIAEPLAQKQNPTSVVDAQFSMPYGIAVALVYGRASIHEYTEAVLADPAVRAAMQKVECVHDPALDARFPQQWPAWTEVETVDGRIFRVNVDYPKGDPENPLTPAEMADKFRDLSSNAVRADRQEAILAHLQTAGPTTPVRALTALLRAE